VRGAKEDDQDGDAHRAADLAGGLADCAAPENRVTGRVETAAAPRMGKVRPMPKPPISWPGSMSAR
jgi:hypothetical protein